MYGGETMERLQKVIAHSGLTSRRKAEDMITAGRVTVNGETVTELGTKVTSSDVVMVDGKPIKKEENVYYVLYKPRNVISTTDDELDRETVLNYIQTEKRIYPVGRLDFDTSGVLLLTNDGDLTNLLIHPSHDLEKEYEVTVKGFLRKEESRTLCRGIELDGTKTKKAKIKDVTYNTNKEISHCTIIITEGRNHQVKRMFESVGHPVLSLKRVRFGPITLKHLRVGEYRRITPHEIKQLRHQAKH